MVRDGGSELEAELENISLYTSSDLTGEITVKSIRLDFRILVSLVITSCLAIFLALPVFEWSWMSKRRLGADAMSGTSTLIASNSEREWEDTLTNGGKFVAWKIRRLGHFLLILSFPKCTQKLIHCSF